MKIAMCKNESCEFNKKCYRYVHNYGHIYKSTDNKIFNIEETSFNINSITLDFQNVKNFDPIVVDTDYLPMCFGPLS